MPNNPFAKTEKLKILVGMSGGVDSSVAAALLVEQGHDVTGGFIKNWSDSKDLWTGECEWRGERRDALRVAARLNIPLLTFDFEEEYRKRVLDRMFAEYREGVTPNPDVLCNEEIKFGLFFETAIKLGFDGIATGHYARVLRTPHPEHRRGQGGGTVAHLLVAIDPAKDQSYFLHRISRESLSKSFFPIGEFKKEDVRRMAEERNLPVASKPDSQGICFVGKLDFHEFLRKRNPPQPGEIVTPEGEVIGKHDGLDGYTIGQRHGIHVSKDGKAWYVAGKDRKQNRIIIVPDREHPLLYSTTARVENIHLLNELPSDGRLDVVVRYHADPVPATLVDGVLTFDKPVWALTPGQSAVFYRGEECLGGGFLSEDRLDFGA
jgi:tRNA-specific 2-thiouridylase